MESDNRGLDLEKELTCSICTEVLYQPLTLLDCLHTFCGSCLKEWFSWQLTSSRNSPSSIPAGSTPYTCPSCRAPVRDTRHNATVNTLLEMYLAANPMKAKMPDEREDIGKKYKPGDEVLPKVEAKEKTLRERRVEDEDRRLMDEVMDLSLRDVAGESSEARRERRRREDGRSHDSRLHSSRGNSRESRNTEERERRRRREGDAEPRRTHDDSSLRPEAGSNHERRRRRSDEEARRRQEENRRSAARQVEHQSSLRSLISQSDVDSREMEEEILRQIREEGLLDGIDLENIDVNQEDQISERIAEAFRRRQSERSRQEAARRSDTNARRRQARTSAVDTVETSGEDSNRTTRRRRTNSRSPSSTSPSDAQNRLPSVISGNHSARLDIQLTDEGRRRRRTTSSVRSATAPAPVAEVDARPAARSQTDLGDRPQSSSITLTRSHGSPIIGSNSDLTVQTPTELPASDQMPRESQSSPQSRSRSRSQTRTHAVELESPVTTPSTQKTHRNPPANIFVPPATLSATPQTTVDRSLVPAPLSPSASSTSSQAGQDRSLQPAPVSTSPREGPRNSLSDRAQALSSGSRPTSSSSVVSRNRPQFYPEPSLSCARCGKTHVEYDLHYNCYICYDGNYNICLPCYRSGAGCLHWFGFVYSIAVAKWEKSGLSTKSRTEAQWPHMLTGNRYIPPKISAGGAEGRRTLTTDDPMKRLQSGVFCANCLAWANECYWRCDSCNEGDWGFCNLCVNQGKSCTHPLLPLTYKPSESYNPPLSPSYDQQTPATATILTGPGVIDVGPFKPLTFSTKCDICYGPIHHSSTRYHCFSCTSAVQNSQVGDYDICMSCYANLVTTRKISVENGHSGWRRCLQGHRMVIVGFDNKNGGQRRVVVQDLVGGRGLHEEPSKSLDHSGADLQKWTWDGDKPHIKLVTTNVSNIAPTSSPGIVIDKGFPPNGGMGMVCTALWSWYPAEGTEDELLFPKGAEIKECKDINQDWYYGSYMGKMGLFPAPYVR